jgi:hypothetical protein
MKPRRVIVEIDEVVLHGFDPLERHRIGDALQTELATLLARAPVDTMPRPALDRINGGSFAVGQEADGASIGRGAARALHRSIT